MKKLCALLIALMLAACLCGCGQDSVLKEVYSISPATLSDETQSILKALGDDTVFFDYKVSSDVRSFAIDLWMCEDGVWTSNGAVSGNIGDIGEGRSGRIGLRATPTSCDVITLDGSGHTRYSSNNGVDFSTVTSSSLMKTNETVSYNLGLPVTLMVRAGTNASEFRTFDLNDFQSMDCEIGYAFTLTFSDQVLD